MTLTLRYAAQSDRGLIRDGNQDSVYAGPRLLAVADGMIAQTAAIEGLDGRLIERNYDFDLLSPGTLIEKAIGAPARLVRTNPRTGQTSEVAVTVRSGPEGIVLQHGDGSTEACG